MSNANEEHSRSVWMEQAPPALPSLQGHIEAEVVVVGAGIAGLSVAYELCCAGRSVAVVERGEIGRGMSARTTAHLASAFDDFYHRVIALHGEASARAILDSHASAVDRIESILQSEGIACDYRRTHGYLCLAPSDNEELLDRELTACRRIGFAGVEPMAAGPLDAGRPALRFPNQARFHPLKYLYGLVEAILRRGGRLFPETSVSSISEQSDGVRIETAGGHKINCGAAVVTTNAPINDRLTLHPKQAPYRTYVIAGSIPRDTIEDALYWDTGDPYHYVRLHPLGTHDLLIVGGEDHKSGTADDADIRFRRLEDWTRHQFPDLQGIAYRWSGQVLEPVDNVAFIGRNPGNQRIHVATGDSGQGMTHGVLAGMLLTGMITSERHAWAEAYAPARTSLRAAGEFVSENLTALRSMAEHLGSGEVRREDDIEPGHGAIIRSGLRKLAVFRDESGTLHRCSATCTHAGCVVRWNSFEKCWDCPCHGSHFAIDGRVLNGPAITALETVEPRSDRSPQRRRSGS